MSYTFILQGLNRSFERRNRWEKVVKWSWTFKRWCPFGGEKCFSTNTCLVDNSFFLSATTRRLSLEWKLIRVEKIRVPGHQAFVLINICLACIASWKRMPFSSFYGDFRTKRVLDCFIFHGENGRCFLKPVLVVLLRLPLALTFPKFRWQTFFCCLLLSHLMRLFKCYSHKGVSKKYNVDPNEMLPKILSILVYQRHVSLICKSLPS